jgi:hypothetical protein
LRWLDAASHPLTWPSSSEALDSLRGQLLPVQELSDIYEYNFQRGTPLMKQQDRIWAAMWLVEAERDRLGFTSVTREVPKDP